MSQSVERFSSRVDDYHKYRPGYPVAVLDLLKSECSLSPGSIVADLGSGTGKLSEPFLTNGNLVYGVEPNGGMRTAAETILREFRNFRSIDGTAESTTLPDSSVDLICAGQAFHWFDPAPTKIEVRRILKPGGWVVLIWNARKLESTPFLEEYEKLLVAFGTDYQDIRHERAEGMIAEFFAPDSFRRKDFPNQQVFDFEGLKGRVRSSSYTPQPGHPDFEPMFRELQLIFDKHQRNGYVVFDYDTRVFYAQPTLNT